MQINRFILAFHERLVQVLLAARIHFREINDRRHPAPEPKRPVVV